MSTIQFDFNLPERFDMTYVGADGQEHRPYMVHRALLGSLERFFGILIEHYAGAFPRGWRRCRSVAIPVAPAFAGYAREVVRALNARGVRAESTRGDERMNAKIRNAQNQKVPYMLILGEKEQAARAVCIRERGGTQSNLVPLEEFLALDRVGGAADDAGLGPGGAMIERIVKRDGRVVPFNREKITSAIYRAAVAVGGRDRERRRAGHRRRARACWRRARTPGTYPTVEEVQDLRREGPDRAGPRPHGQGLHRLPVRARAEAQRAGRA